MSKKKKGLIESLKSLLGLDQKPEYMGAMCYETHMPLWKVMKCDCLTPIDMHTLVQKYLIALSKIRRN